MSENRRYWAFLVMSAAIVGFLQRDTLVAFVRAAAEQLVLGLSGLEDALQGMIERVW